MSLYLPLVLSLQVAITSGNFYPLSPYERAGARGCLLASGPRPTAVSTCTLGVTTVLLQDVKKVGVLLKALPVLTRLYLVSIRLLLRLVAQLILSRPRLAQRAAALVLC